MLGAGVLGAIEAEPASGLDVSIAPPHAVRLAAKAAWRIERLHVMRCPSHGV
jgi:hypothetical protein